MSRDRDTAPEFLLSSGTQVVTRVAIQNAQGRPVRPKGAVGVIVALPRDPQHAYRVRFADGEEVALKRQDLAILKHHHRDAMAQAATPMSEQGLDQYIIYRCIVGSRAFGLDEAESDIDRRGIYLPPAHLHWSLYGVPEQLEDPDTDECYWELQKFLTLALKGNPNIMECLYTPIVELSTPLADELRAMRGKFLSQFLYQTYNGYVISQFKRIGQELRNRGRIKWKHVMHLVRLLLSGLTAMREGTIMVDVGPMRDRLLEIRRGQWRWQRVDQWRLELQAEFDAAYEHTELPERPDYEAANAFLIKARYQMT